MSSAINKQSSKALGEVIESTSYEIAVESHTLYKTPPLGGIIKILSDPEIFGLVTSIKNVPFDNTRQVVARGHEELNEETLYTSNPQIEKLLVTTFSCLLVGTKSTNEIIQNVPSTPPKIHAFVYECTNDDLKKFTSSTNFVNLLMHSENNNFQEILLHSVKHISKAIDNKDDFIMRVGKTIISLHQGNLSTMTSLLVRLGNVS